MFRKSKPITVMSPERQALAMAINDVAAAEAAIAKTTGARSQASDKMYAAEAAAERAEAALQRSGEAMREYVRDLAGSGSDRPPPGLQRRGPGPEQRREKALQDAAIWRSVRDATHDVEAEQQSDLDSARLRLSQALRVAIAADRDLCTPVLERLEALNREASAVRMAAHAMLRAGGLGGELERRLQNAMGRFGRLEPWALADYAPPRWQSDPVHRLMADAFDRLKADPLTSLPTLREILEAGRG